MAEKSTDQAACEAVLLAETCERKESNPVTLGSLFLSAVPDEPTFAELSDGCQYEHVQVVGTFYGPPTEDGGKVAISP